MLMGIILPAGTIIADDDHLEARRLMEAGSIQSLEIILERVKKKQMGRVLEVKLEQEHGRYIYEIDLLDDNGRVWELEYDAVNGELLDRSQED